MLISCVIVYKLIDDEEAPPTNNEDQGTQGALPTNTTNQGVQGALPIFKAESSDEDDSINEQEENYANNNEDEENNGTPTENTTNEEHTATKRVQIIAEDVTEEELATEESIPARHNHNTRNESRTYSHLHKDHMFNMQGKQIPNTDTFTNDGFTPVPPHQNAQNNIHNHMMATKACFAQLGT